MNDAWARILLSKVKVASRIKVITHLRPRRSPRREARTAVPGTAPGTNGYQDPTQEEWLPKIAATQDFLKSLGT